MTVWRANLLGSSGKGHEYFLKHMLGAAEPGVRAEEAAPEHRPRDVTWREAPEAKLDLFTTIDFRMTSNALFSDVVLPAATWYEKHDLSTTDLHPFVHTFNPAIPPPWEARTDWDSFKTIAEKFSQLAEKHLGVRRDIIAAPLAHDTPDEISQPHGQVLDWRAGECEPIPGKTMPKLIVVERDYPNVAAHHAALGPLTETLGATRQGRVVEAGRRGGVAGPPERAGARRSRRRPTIARPRGACLRGDPGALGHDQRPHRPRRVPLAGGALWRAAGVAGRAARGGADHVRRRPGATTDGVDLAGVVGNRRARPPLQPVHHQRRARQAVAHALGPAALLP